MNPKNETVVLRTHRSNLYKQLNLLLDFLPECDNLEYQQIVITGIYYVRSQIKATEGLSIVELSQHIEVKEIILNSKINGDPIEAEHEHTICNKSTMAVYRVCG